jgi:hypothetical protein
LRTKNYALSRYLRPLAVEIELVAHWWWRFATIALLPISYERLPIGIWHVAAVKEVI